MAAALKLTCALMLCMVVAAPMASAMTCGQVLSAMQPCLNYLKGGGTVPAGCCAGVKGLLGQAKTTTDRQTACNCLKNAAASIRGLNPTIASGLPGKCGVNIPYKISPNTDCKSVK